MAERKAIKELIKAAEMASKVLGRFSDEGRVDATGAKFNLDMALFDAKPIAEQRRIEKRILATK